MELSALYAIIVEESVTAPLDAKKLVQPWQVSTKAKKPRVISICESIFYKRLAPIEKSQGQSQRKSQRQSRVEEGQKRADAAETETLSTSAQRQSLVEEGQKRADAAETKKLQH